MAFDYRKFINEFFRNDANIGDISVDTDADGFVIDIRFYTFLSGSDTFDPHKESEFVEEFLDELVSHFDDNRFEDTEWIDLEGDDKGFLVTLTGDFPRHVAELREIYFSQPKQTRLVLYNWAMSYKKGMETISVDDNDVKKSRLDKLQKLGLITYSDEYITSMGYHTWTVQLQPLLEEMIDAYTMY